jgi:AraC-like DNA-binding protein
MSAVIRAPRLALAPFVERLGYYTGYTGGFAGDWEPVPPTGADHLLVSMASGGFQWRIDADPAATWVRSGTAVVPGSEGRVRIDFSQWSEAVFVSFHPGGAYPFLGVAPAATGEPLLDLEAVWGRDAGRLRGRLAEAATAEAALTFTEEALLAHAVRSLERDPILARAIPALDQGVPVAQVAAGLQVSQSTLLRRFTAQVGMPPKQFARVRRLRRLLATTHGKPGTAWAGAAAECGYFDQAHMITEFRSLTGMTPTQYDPRLTEPYEPGLPA